MAPPAPPTPPIFNKGSNHKSRQSPAGTQTQDQNSQQDEIIKKIRQKLMSQEPNVPSISSLDNGAAGQLTELLQAVEEVPDAPEPGQEESKLMDEYEKFSDEENDQGDENKFFEKVPGSGGIMVQSEI